MKILAIDSSAVSASAAVLDGAKIIGEGYVNVGLTHSQTLLPMIDAVLSNAGISVKDIDKFAVTNGPGSFTGIRIGVAAVKGLAAVGDRECIGISTLEAMAYNFALLDCTVCCAMDARCGQVYTATFKCCSNGVERITEDCAKSVTDLGADIKSLNSHVIMVGDGAEMCYNMLKDICDISLAPEHLRYQRAFGAAYVALSGKYEFISADRLEVKYLRMPQAERELMKKKELL